MSWRVLQYFGLGKDSERPTRTPLTEEDDDPALMMTGEALTTAILENIRLRRSVLVTGPRGCGKTYCTEQAIKLAKAHGIIGGSRFLQGNREIPRDVLSEDMLIVGAGGKVELLTALALRPLEDSGSITREEFPDWPGIPPGLGIDPTREWTNRDWIVLFLDEINRFGDGFLDSLLALLEERKIVRRGQDYYVPIIVVATANPPGYDMTAKKLSPPLQARITRSFRVSQPDVNVLVHGIMPSKIIDFARAQTQGTAPEVPLELRYLAAGATLCLWGDPAGDCKGKFFLTRGTRQMLTRLMAADDGLARDMRELSTLIDFGPDARAITDWIGCAMARASTAEEKSVSARHLEETAVHVLSHKVREKFNEGANPNLGSRRDRLILNVVQRLLRTPGYAERFGFIRQKAAPPPVRAAAPAFTPVRLTDLQVSQIIGEFPNTRVFAEPLSRGYPRYCGTVLPTADHLRIWANTLDGTLQPYATPGDVQQIVSKGFWALVRSLCPEQQLDMQIVRQVGELYDHTYQALEGAANPAGQERASSARRAIAQVVDAVIRSPANPQNAPQASPWSR